ncbi:MAG: diguanylate cyclase [Polyangiaceae bacterium]|nr:diguanylate cyclase [Polyangiaceae bacterium]
MERAPAFGTEVDILDFARREQLVVVPLAMRKVTAGHALLLPQEVADLAQPGLDSALGAPRSAPSAPGAGLDVRSSDARRDEARQAADSRRSGERVAGSSMRPAADARRTRAAPLLDGLLKLLATQAATSLALLAERERASGGAAMKDPASSAYSFAYYVDVAGREIDKAKRYGRRFTIATIVLEPAGPEGAPPAQALDPAEVVDQLLDAVRDTDILARVEENELHLLMPETAGLEAHACYRRMLAKLAGDRRGGHLPTGMLVGFATFPHDGQGLAQLLRVARRRAEATKDSIVHQISPHQQGLADLLEILDDAASMPSVGRFAISAPRPLELALPEAVTLATSVVKSALRGGAAFIAVAHHPGLSLGAAVRAVVGSPREEVVLHALDVRSSPGCDDIEALCVIAEHGAYAFMGRSRGGVVRGVHAADPLLADFLAERLGRAAGLRVFG